MLICPIHNKELKHFEGIGKTSGKPYSNDKCTHKDERGFCTYVIWAEDKEVFTKKFSQTPNGVVETEEVWPTEATKTAPESEEKPKSDIRTILNEINDKLDAIRKFQLGEHD